MSHSYHTMMQNHLNTTGPRVVLKNLTPAELLDIARRPLPVFVNGVRTDGPVSGWERLELARGERK